MTKKAKTSGAEVLAFSQAKDTVRSVKGSGSASEGFRFS